MGGNLRTYFLSECVPSWEHRNTTFMHTTQGQGVRSICRIFLLISTIAFLLLFIYCSKDYNFKNSPPMPSSQLTSAKEHIIPIKDTKHFMVSAFKDHKEKGAIRIISIVARNQQVPLYCVFYCTQSEFQSNQARVEMHSDHFGFEFHTSDVLCESKPQCDPTHVTLSTLENGAEAKSNIFLPIQNRYQQDDNFAFNFTVCISNMFNSYNNVLQFVQTMEVYKLLGIQKVVIYNTSCGADVEKVLNYYSQEGFLDVVQWPIDRFLTPSQGWMFSQHGGDIHYYGQITTLNECVHRNRYQSRYVLLNDIDEIIMPYKHSTLDQLITDLLEQNPKAGIFMFENHVFPKTQFDDSQKFHLPEWDNVPGVNILEHIYREPFRTDRFNARKMIVDPRQVVQTSVHSVLKSYTETLWISFDVGRLVHIRTPEEEMLQKEELSVDTRLWDFEKELVLNVNQVLHKSGILH